MRVKAVELSGFRGFAQKQVIDLDADAVIVVGANGCGKTSLFDAILWAVTGRISRLGSDDSSLLSMYSETGEARVALELLDPSSKRCRLERTFDGEHQQLTVWFDDDLFKGDTARTRLLERLWPEALATPDGSAAITSAMTRSVYLQQDRVREFVEADTEQDRFKAVSELVGAGRVSDLQVQLEAARKAWSTVTNRQTDEERLIAQRVASLEGQLTRLSSPDARRPKTGRWADAWSEWWKKSKDLGVSVEAPAAADSVNAPSALDATIKQLETLRRGIERRLSSARELLSDVLAHPAIALPDEEALRKAVDHAQRELDEARKALVDAQNRSAKERADLVRAQEEREEIKALAEIALRHLGVECPVCGQTYDQVSTRRRLEDLARGPSQRADVPETQNSVAELAKIVEQREGAHRNAAEALRQAEKTVREWRAWASERDRRLAELQIILEPSTDIVQKLQQVIEQLVDSSKVVASHHREGEKLTIVLARAGEEARRLELQQELDSARSEAKQSARNLRLRNETGRLVDRIVEGLRGAASEVVTEQLRGIEPLLQRIYATMDPHPAFRVVRLLASFSYGRGHLRTVIDDPLANVSSESPENVLSSSQNECTRCCNLLGTELGCSQLSFECSNFRRPSTEFGRREPTRYDRSSEKNQRSTSTPSFYTRS